MTFGGNLTSRPFAAVTVVPSDDLFVPLLQLAFDTLVAVVDTLLTLPLLYLVNAEVLVAALLAIELRQLLDAVDADMTETWEADADAAAAAAAEAGDTPRWRAKAAESESASEDEDDEAGEEKEWAEEEEEGGRREPWSLPELPCALFAKPLTVDAPHIPMLMSFARLEAAVLPAGPARYLRPRAYAGSSSETMLEFALAGAYRDGGCDDANDELDGGACGCRYGDVRGVALLFCVLGALRPMMRFVTLLAVEDIGRPSSLIAGGGGGGGLLDELLLPNPSFHFDGFFVIVGAGGAGAGTWTVATGVVGLCSAGLKPERVDESGDVTPVVLFDLDWRLISRANA